MFRQINQALTHHPVVLTTAVAVSVLVGACSDKNAESASNATPQVQTQAPAENPVQSAPPATTAVAPAPASAPAAAPGRIVPVNVQAVSPMGLTVRVKQIELTDDATVLTVSLSLGGDRTIFTSLVDGETYLRDEAGNKLMPKLPPENRFLRVRKGETLEGQLVFMGALPANTRQAEWVINEGNAPDNDSGPGMRLALPIGTAG